MISVVIDDLTMETQKSVLEYPRLVDSVKEFVKNDMGPADQVAVLSGSRKVQLPFTNDKQRLLAELASVPTELNIDTKGHAPMSPILKRGICPKTFFPALISEI